MKIAILTLGGVDRSGSDRVIPCLLWHIERLVRAGDEVHVFALRQEAEPGRWPLLGAQVHNAGNSKLRLLAQLRCEHRQASFNVIHALWCRPAGVLAAIAGPMLGVPVLLHMIGGDLACLPDIGFGGRISLRGRALQRLAVMAAGAVAVETHAAARQTRMLGISAVRAPFGVASDAWPRAAPRRRVAQQAARLLHVGSLNAVKDPGTLLRAMARLRAQGIGFSLDIIGEDTLGGAMQRLARDLGVAEQVRFLGFRPHHALRENFDRADMLIISSRHEGAPVAALEAAMAGVAVVGTRVGHLADWAEQGALDAAAPGDSDGLARIIAHLLAHEDQRLSLALRLQQKAVAEDADATARHMRGLYLALSRMPAG